MKLKLSILLCSMAASILSVAYADIPISKYSIHFQNNGSIPIYFALSGTPYDFTSDLALTTNLGTTKTTIRGIINPNTQQPIQFLPRPDFYDYAMMGRDMYIFTFGKTFQAANFALNRPSVYLEFNQSGSAPMSWSSNAQDAIDNSITTTTISNEPDYIINSNSAAFSY